MDEAVYAVKYAETEGGAAFAWFITGADAKAFADYMGRRENMTYQVVEL